MGVSSYVHFGVFIKIVRKNEKKDVTRFGCPKHKLNEDEGTKFCPVCGTKLQDIVIKEVSELDYFDGFEDDWIEAIGERKYLILITMDDFQNDLTDKTGIKQVYDIDRDKVINDFKNKHSKYFKYLDNLGVEYRPTERQVKLATVGFCVEMEHLREE